MSETNKEQIKVVKPQLVHKVSLIDTLRDQKPMTRVTYRSREAGLFATAQSCVSRLNKAAGKPNWRITTDDCGATYTVTRLN